MTWSIPQILEHYKKSKILESTIGILEWDQETYMPTQSVNIRSEQLSFLYGEHFKLQTHPEFVSSVLKAHSPNPREQKILSKLRIEVAKKTALDENFVQKITVSKVKTLEAWKVARSESNFSKVQEALSEIVALKREEALRLSEHKLLKDHFNGCSLYEIMLDEYEPGMKAQQLRTLLNQLVEGTKLRLEKIIDKQKSQDWKSIAYPMPKADQRELSLKIIKQLDFPMEHGRLDESHHPFCGGNPEDVRMTTRYDESDFLNALFSSIHETGHGIYEASFPRDLIGTPCASGASTGVHESQSRFYENFIGRSQAFCDYLGALTGKNSKELFESLNLVEKSLIRVDADEVTYNLHIALRMKIEESLIEGKNEVKDIPEVWNSTFKDYFGIQVPSDTKGCLQDIHWHGGSFGYFPGYSIGNLLAAEIHSDFSKQFPDWEDKVRNGSFVFIKDYLYKKVHHFAALDNSPGTIKNILPDRDLGAEAFLKYLDNKYLNH